MKKNQISRKLSLNKQTLNQLDASLMHAVRGGQAVTNPTATNPTVTTDDQRTAAQCPGY